MKKLNLSNIIKEEIYLILTEFKQSKYQEILKKIENLSPTKAIHLLYKLTVSNKIGEDEFEQLSKDLISKINRAGYAENINQNEIDYLVKEQVSILIEMSITQIKDKIFDILNLDIAKQYQKDEFTYENIPIELFANNGITFFYLQQYSNSEDITTYDLGVEIDKTKKTVDIFLQKDSIFK